MRYVLGPAVSPFDVTVHPVLPPPPDTPLVDVVGALISYGNDGVVLQFPAFDTATHQAPAEVRLYLVAEGDPTFATVDEYLGSNHPVQVATPTIDPAGANVTVPIPPVSVGRYLGQVVYGYAV